MDNATSIIEHTFYVEIFFLIQSRGATYRQADTGITVTFAYVLCKLACAAVVPGFWDKSVSIP